ncbi:MAG: S8 family serine peptidase [Flavobacteriales bacterium]|nr:S8 family serine peptidase [Flavobacteriales bacterium]
MRLNFITLLFFLSSVETNAQQKFWVFFTDKEGVEFDPYTYFDEKAIQRRLREGLSIYDMSDFPVNANYIYQVKMLADSIGAVSRWFNAVSSYISDDKFSAIASLPCVLRMEPVCEYQTELSSSEQNWEPDEPDLEKIRFGQIESLGAYSFRKRNIDGAGVRIAILDAGFKGFQTAGPLKHLRESNRVIATYDFIGNKKFVFDFSDHGTEVTTCVAGILDDKRYGMATGSEFLLARTERSRGGTRTDEDHWIASLEWADKWGADMINSSLGYTIQLYFRHQLDGQHSMISRAATMAISKGIMVISSAGNEGQSNWELISVPADADSVLTIGAIDPWTGMHSDFSSYGPTFDLRMKPNLVAFGYAVVEQNGEEYLASGTSFAAPLVAGLAACIRQQNPNWTCQELFQNIECSGHLYPYYDYAHGHGIPNAKYFTEDYTEPLNCPECFKLEYNKKYGSSWEGYGPSLRVELDTLCLQGLIPVKMEDWENLENYSEKAPLWYFHLAEADGFIQQYFVAEASNEMKLFYLDKIPNDSRILRIFYDGHHIVIPVSQIAMKDE